MFPKTDPLAKLAASSDRQRAGLKLAMTAYVVEASSLNADPQLRSTRRMKPAEMIQRDLRSFPGSASIAIRYEQVEDFIDKNRPEMNPQARQTAALIGTGLSAPISPWESGSSNLFYFPRARRQVANDSISKDLRTMAESGIQVVVIVVMLPAYLVLTDQDGCIPTAGLVHRGTIISPKRDQPFTIGDLHIVMV